MSFAKTQDQTTYRANRINSKKKEKERSPPHWPRVRKLFVWSSLAIGGIKQLGTHAIVVVCKLTHLNVFCQFTTKASHCRRRFSMHALKQKVRHQTCHPTDRRKTKNRRSNTVNERGHHERRMHPFTGRGISCQAGGLGKLVCLVCNHLLDVTIPPFVGSVIPLLNHKGNCTMTS